MKQRVMLLALAVLCRLSWAAPSFSCEEDSRWHLLNFQIAPLVVVQNNQGENFSVELSWTPGYQISDLVDIYANIGALPLNVYVGDVFLVSEATLFIAFPGLGSVYPEFGGGAQFWISHGGTAPVVGTNLVFATDVALFGELKLKSVALGYSHVFLDDPAHFPKAVFTLDFGDFITRN